MAKSIARTDGFTMAMAHIGHVADDLAKDDPTQAKVLRAAVDLATECFTQAEQEILRYRRKWLAAQEEAGI